MSKKKDKKRDWPGEKAFYLIWNPNYPTPPKVMFQTLNQAEIAARRLTRLETDPFFILKAVKKVQAPPREVIVTNF